MMTDDQRRRWKERYRNAPVKNLQASLANASSEHQRLINELIDEIRHAADAPAQQRFKDYEQRERHHRQLIWCTLIGVVIGAVIGAAATWWFSSRGQANDRLRPAPLAVVTPPPTLEESVPTPSESPAVISPAPTLEESVPTLEGEGPAPEESPPTEEPPAPEELVPAPEESVPTPPPQGPWSTARESSRRYYGPRCGRIEAMTDDEHGCVRKHTSSRYAFTNRSANGAAMNRKRRGTMTRTKHIYGVRPRKDKRGVDLISDNLPFG
jgi:hypothetical protein